MNWLVGNGSCSPFLGTEGIPENICQPTQIFVARLFSLALYFKSLPALFTYFRLDLSRWLAPGIAGAVF